MILNFYTRNGCLLCNDAKVLLEMISDDIGFELNEINIDESDQLTEAYGLRIPVVEMNNEVIQEGFIDPEIIETYVNKQKGAGISGKE